MEDWHMWFLPAKSQNNKYSNREVIIVVVVIKQQKKISRGSIINWESGFSEVMQSHIMTRLQVNMSFQRNNVKEN